MATGLARRDLIAFLSSVTATTSFPSWAQHIGRLRTIGVLMGLTNDAESMSRIKAFEYGLEREGWLAGQNMQIEYRFGENNVSRMATLASELVALKPDVLVSHSTPATVQLAKATGTIPIVFVVVADPVGSGFVASIRRPGGNITGFTNLAATITGKLLTILRELTPKLKHVALLFSPDASIAAGKLFLHPLEAAAPAFGVKVIPARVRQPADIETRMTELARATDVGLIVMPDNFTTINRDLIVALAARFRIPTIYPYRFFVEAGGLVSYGVDVTDLFRRAPEYVSRILRGEAPALLPVQAPTKFELMINLKTAKALGLTVPKYLLSGADTLID